MLAELERRAARRLRAGAFGLAAVLAAGVGTLLLTAALWFALAAALGPGWGAAILGLFWLAAAAALLALAGASAGRSEPPPPATGSKLTEAFLVGLEAGMEARGRRGRS